MSVRPPPQTMAATDPDGETFRRLLQQSESRFRRLFETARDGILLLNGDTGQIEDANPYLIALLGYSHAEFLGRKLREVGAFADTASSEEKFANLQTIGMVRYDHLALKTKAGAKVDVEFVSNAYECEGVKVIQCNIRDITESKRTGKVLAEYAAIVESTDDAIVSKTLDGVITNWNKGAERMLGYRADEIIGRSILTLIPEERYGEEQEIAEKIRRGKFVNHYETVRRCKDGRLIDVSVTISPLRNPQGEIVGASKIARDITERKQAERALLRYKGELEDAVQQRTAELRQARDAANIASRSKSSFLANMSHEIRTPMNAIIGLTHLLRRAAPTPLQTERLEKIDVAASHLLSIINDILDLSKVEAGRLELEHTNFELGTVLDHVRSLIADQAQAKGLVIKVDPDSVPLWLRGDPTRLRQALLNYAGNAVKFTEQGSVELRATLLEDRGDELTVRFEVQDTGVGIAAERLPDLFQAFEQADTSTTRQYGGTGLGLAITKQLAILMGGDAGAHSLPGQGSTFWFTAVLQRGHGVLPVHSTHSEDAEAELRRHFAGTRLLLVEDDPVNQEVALELLHVVGLAAQVAGNGREAVEMAARDSYALILMDMQMPQLNGLDATRAIRLLPDRAATPILAMTANAFSDDRKACDEAGMNDFIAKPVNAEDLYRTLLKWLRLSAPVSSVVPESRQKDTVAPSVDAVERLARLARVEGLDVAQALAGMTGNTARFLRVMKMFADSGSGMVRQLTEAIPAENMVALEQAAHTLKGYAVSLGAVKLGEMAAALDAAIRLHSNEESIVALSNALNGELKRLTDDIGAVFEQP